MDLGFVAHLRLCQVPATQTPRLPFLLESEAAPPEVVTVHLLAGKGLPQVGCHSILPNGCFQVVPLPLCPLRHCIVRAIGVLPEQDHQLQGWGVDQRQVVDAYPGRVDGRVGAASGQFGGDEVEAQAIRTGN